MSHPKVCVIILNWNGVDDTIECLESLKKATYPDFETIGVDNGSTGNDAAILSENFGGFIHVIENERNYGFAEGCNVGMRRALEQSHPDYVLLLNNDTVVAPDLLSALIRSCEADPSVGIAGPKTYFYHDPNRIQSAGGQVHWSDGFASLYGTNEMDQGQFNEARPVDWVSGCALFVKTKTIEDIGLLYAPYFAYYEEVDWCTRAKRGGYKVVYVPEARVWHKNRMSLDVISTTSFYYTTRNRILFMRRNATAVQFAFFLIQFVLGHTLSLAARALLMRSQDKRLLGPYFKGMQDGLLLVLAGKADTAKTPGRSSVDSRRMMK